MFRVLSSMIVACGLLACGSSDDAGGTAGGGGTSPTASGGKGGTEQGGANAGGSAPVGPPSADGGTWIPDYFPTNEWQVRDPSELGYDSATLEAAIAFADASATEGLLIVQDGYIVAEEYFAPFTQEMRHQSFSVAKSFTSALVGIAIDEGLLSGVEERLCAYYDAWDCGAADDPRSEITLHHVMTLSSGLDWNEEWSEGANYLDNDAVQMSTSGRPIDYVLGKQSAHEPGTVFQYSTGDPALLSGVLQGATGMTALEFARARIFTTIGAESIEWAADADGRTMTFANLQATVRDYARFGFLYLNRGNWDGTQVVPAEWVDVSTQSGVSLEDWYGYLWHVNLPSRFEDPALPADGYTAQGVSGQFVTVIPSERLVVVRVANDGIFGAEFDIAGLLTRILAAKKQ